eukprot:scaffold98330_cov28-Attheya_sp.AAC.2
MRVAYHRFARHFLRMLPGHVVLSTKVIQQQKQNEPSDDIGEQINGVDVENEMPNIETVKSLIAKVQKNMANAINDDEIVETDHGTDDLDETESGLWMGPYHWRNFVIVGHATRLKIYPS